MNFCFGSYGDAVPLRSLNCPFLIINLYTVQMYSN